MNNVTDQRNHKDAEPNANQAQSFVQAWARDSRTGEPIYIMELGPTRRGNHCGCECPSCDQPLTAVNAAKSEYIKRPHFRHPHGAGKSECMYLSARLAALQLLRDAGVMELPARRVAGKVVGLSGTQHEVWIVHPAERVKIRHFDFRDRAAALITLDDGRQLFFNLFGSAICTEDGNVIPSIYLDLDDSEMAGLGPEELRKRASLVPNHLCWNSHWNDTDLKMRADTAAMERAIDLMDLEGDFHTELTGVEEKFRRETLLHLEVKKILSEVQHIRVPGIQCHTLRTADDGHDIEEFKEFPSEFIPLLSVTLEQRFGRLIPDVTAKTPDEHGGVLLIEVTVTNPIRRERQAHIQNSHVPVLEVDLSRAGGLITRSELRNLLIDDIEFKCWLCHPKAQQCQQELEAAVDKKIQTLNWAIQEREAKCLAARQASVEQIAHDYLLAILQYETLARVSLIEDFERLNRLREKVGFHAQLLGLRGYPEAADRELTGTRSQIIPRILAIKNGGGVGYELDSTMGVMNAIRQARPENRKFHTIYLIAEAVYRREDSPDRPAWYHNWVEEIKRSIVLEEKMYVRPRRYDRLIALLFPEMLVNLAKPFGTEDFIPKSKARTTVSTQGTTHSANTEHTSPSSVGMEHFESLWLMGRELEQWKLTHPNAAREFFNR